MSTGWKEHRYLTDDRDRESRPELVVAWADNGDFYIATTREEGDYPVGRFVRICNGVSQLREIQSCETPLRPYSKPWAGGARR